MNKTHGDILHDSNTTNGPTINDLIYRMKPEDTTGGSSVQVIYNPPRHRGEVGWICPVCGRGNAPSTAYCNCNIIKPDIVYANGGTSIGTILDDTIPPEPSYTTTATNSPNGEDWVKVDTKLHCPAGALNF